MILLNYLLIFTLINLNHGANQWPNHDISTLKLLQVVHRHGDRTPLDFKPNDPYSDQHFWPEGFGQLTSKGKYRMYKRGQFIRQAYNDFLGDSYSPRDVFVRSSVSDRCLESVSCLLSGAYPPKKKDWQWNEGSDASLGQLWQPFPIQTFMPKNEDLVLNEGKHCKVAEEALANIFNRSEVHNFLDENKELYANLSKITGSNIDTVLAASSLYVTLGIETSRGYYWDKVWTKEEELDVIKRLAPADDIKYRYGWDSPVTKRLRGGGLVRELNTNLRRVLDEDRDVKKLYVYSTHDGMLSVVMQALNVFNYQFPPFGAALYLELHESSGGHFVRAYYHNETDVGQQSPHLLEWRDCRALNNCPIDEYLNSTKHLLYDNFDKECLN